MTEERGVRADPFRISQIVGQHRSNALKFQPGARNRDQRAEGATIMFADNSYVQTGPGGGKLPS